MATAHGFTAAHMAANRGNTAALTRLLDADASLANTVRFGCVLPWQPATVLTRRYNGF